MAFLTRENILNFEDISTEIVSVPEWGGDVMVRAMTGYERDAFEGSLVEHKKSGNTIKVDNIRAKLVQKTVIDPETRKPMFTAGDLEILGSKSAAALDRIFTVSRKLSGLTEEDIEELEKN
jgi:hypothetical protein